jgi:DNA-binding winged helix-turn-helix (wHTH) protein
MLETGNCAGFRQKAGGRLRFGRTARQQALDRHAAFQAFVFSQKDLPHAAGAETTQDAVSADALRRRAGVGFAVHRGYGNAFALSSNLITEESVTIALFHPVPRYRFDDFIVSPRRRVLLRGGRELPLIPRYFDLLVFLIENRHDAVHRRDIFDRVWSDVIVSDSALSQAIRTIRRTLGDDSREPRFIRTVSRHGYRFVFELVSEEEDDGPADVSPSLVAPATPGGLKTGPASVDEFERLIARLTAAPSSVADEEDQREAAELLHTLGATEALARIGSRPGHARARALLRDARWDLPRADRIPILGSPAPLAVAGELVALRLRRAARMLARRWAGATIGGGAAGFTGGAVGGLILAAAPDSGAPITVAPVLAAIGLASGALGASGVSAGLCVAEASSRSWRTFALMLGGLAGGGATGAIVQWIGRGMLAVLVGLVVPIGGALEGLVIGGAAGVGYAVATRRVAGGLAAPSGRSRFYIAASTALCCALAAVALALAGRPLVGGTINTIAHAARSAQGSLAPLGRLIGDPEFGRVSQAVLAAGEGIVFGFGLALGLTHRPRRT